jgi:hypothetical protein
MTTVGGVSSGTAARTHEPRTRKDDEEEGRLQRDVRPEHGVDGHALVDGRVRRVGVAAVGERRGHCQQAEQHTGGRRHGRHGVRVRGWRWAGVKTPLAAAAEAGAASEKSGSAAAGPRTCRGSEALRRLPRRKRRPPRGNGLQHGMRCLRALSSSLQRLGSSRTDTQTAAGALCLCRTDAAAGRGLASERRCLPAPRCRPCRARCVPTSPCRLRASTLLRLR